MFMLARTMSLSLIPVATVTFLDHVRICGEQKVNVFSRVGVCVCVV